ncbi:MerR family transcriptional regulator [Rhizobium leguminosarum]|uniref:MerR family transcriptional regulator n=1 Tax=Rhizobium leguminosarum TaxID=384 RepID=UPI001C97ECD0|nr:MerR family transcriptional regulator [Rhizobium leguminosarum]MBY5775461.1 MerR family transcriptional regulator [Rhizobium leguminosarum]
MIPAGRVQTLTGLTANQLREWSNRRNLVPPDIEARGPGRPALYSWQTVLLLRIAVVLRERFKIELQSHKDLLHALRDLFSGVPFPALRGCVLALRAMEHGELLHEGMVSVGTDDQDTLFLRLNPHLDVLEVEFALQDQSGQLPLFRAVRVR